MVLWPKIHSRILFASQSTATIAIREEHRCFANQVLAFAIGEQTALHADEKQHNEQRDDKSGAHFLYKFEILNIETEDVLKEMGFSK